MNTGTSILLAVLFVYNSITAILAGLDKKAAKTGGRRRRERDFLIFSITGGGVGVLAAFYALRHKTKKPVFMGQVWTLTVLSGIVIVFFYDSVLRYA
ncbi:DUF1294 domain-containing protein [Oscillospiraceae bacterium OttesenSCG-928-G22]|nr:DUF1294 domain-containing protein [Oscillospiraceae bacterium OttesenSCG-928-G22]